MSDDEQSYVDLTTEEEIEALMCDDGGAAIIDFWSPSCGPCMAMAKDFGNVASQFEADEVRFCKVNTATHPWLAAAFKIQSVPTILFVNRGQVVDSIIGAVPAAKLGQRAEWLAKKAASKGLFGRLLGR